MARAMATTVSTPLPQPISSCSPSRKLISSCSATSLPRESVSRVQIGLSIPRPSFRHICTWNGLKHLGISCRHRNRSRANKERYIGRIYASLFGVGAPEALVIGVVALLVFGPKGLAEVARNLGQTLRAFQPTIKELQDVSREFKSTLEREIGLDETQRPTNNSAYQSSVFNPQAGVNPNGNPSPKQPYPSEELASATLDSSSNAEPQGAPTLQTSEVANTTPTTVSSENSQGGDKP